jgi:hypothetical protein
MRVRAGDQQEYCTMLQLTKDPLGSTHRQSMIQRGRQVRHDDGCRKDTRADHPKWLVVLDRSRNQQWARNESRHEAHAMAHATGNLFSPRNLGFRLGAVLGHNRGSHVYLALAGKHHWPMRAEKGQSDYHDAAIGHAELLTPGVKEITPSRIP